MFIGLQLWAFDIGTQLFAFLLWAQEEAPEGPTPSPMPFWFMLLVLSGPILLYMFLVQMPKQRAEQKRQRELLDSLDKNQKVLLHNGVIGTVSSVNKDNGQVVIKLEEGKMRVLKTAIVGPYEEKKDENKDSAAEAKK